MLGRSNWNVNCTRAGDKPGYLWNTEGGRDFLSKLKADSVFIMRSDFQHLRTKYDKPGSMFRVNRGQQEARLN